MIISSLYINAQKTTGYNKSNPWVEVKLEYEAVNCGSSTNNYVADIYVRQIKSIAIEYMGNHSIFLNYDPNVLKYAFYKPVNFHKYAKCKNPWGTYFQAWEEPAIDHKTPGSFLLTNELDVSLNADCQEFHKWTLVGKIFFDVLKVEESPLFSIYGTQQGYPKNTRGTNFSDEKNRNKYNQYLHNLAKSPSFKALCGANKKDVFENDVIISEINIYPNPANKIVNVINRSGESSSLKVFNLDGQLILEEEILEGDKKSIEVFDWPAGNYLFQVVNANGELFTEKVIITN